MSSQNNMAKESSSLQNHIFWLCFHLRHTKYPNHAQPRFQPSNCVILKNLETLSTFTQYMSVSHGHSTMDGIEYDDGGCVEKTKKEKVSH